MAELYVGLMSGTSMDGVDAALCVFEAERFAGVRATHTVAYAEALRQRLLALQRELQPIALGELAELDNAVAQGFVAATLGLLAKAGVEAGAVRAIGSHGQTVFHDPERARSSLQLGNPAWISQHTGIDTVADFRRADIALGGHGAPLVPAFHHAQFARAGEARCIVNIGGIANLTILPGDDRAAVRGFDTGPGNGLMDEWAELHLSERFDAGGRFAAAGTLHEPLLAALQADPYFGREPPKSTGRAEFNLAWAQRRYPRLGHLRPADVQRTFCELTVRTLTQAIRRHAPDTRRVLPCGGGARNEFLLARLREAQRGIAVETSDAWGLDAGAVETSAFAWLAMRAIHGLPGNLPGVTGASREAVLGGVYRA
jgi:anhydro-N-acetylmuramic acid kinase